jgi:hypothetical protein
MNSDDVDVDDVEHELETLHPEAAQRASELLEMTEDELLEDVSGDLASEHWDEYKTSLARAAAWLHVFNESSEFEEPAVDGAMRFIVRCLLLAEDAQLRHEQTIEAVDR